jgi:NADPH:quinone reductase-like Zn-dependent oxidoreductase
VKAAAFYEYGPAEVMQYSDMPDPSLGPEDVLIQVRACGVNHSDLDSRAGTSRWPFELPMVLGAEFTGTVVATGGRAGAIRTGDLVTALQQYSCGHCDACTRWRPDLCGEFEIFGTTRWGGYGELVCVPARVVVPLEPSDDPLAVAAAQCVVSTAWHMVNRLATVRHGDLVLVPSASGGVGSALIQCAKLVGATVVATTGSEEKVKRVESLGADEVVRYNAGDLKDALLDRTGGRRFDAVLDSVAGPHFGTHLEVLREDGTLVTCGAHGREVVRLDVVKLFQYGWRIVGFRIAPPDELRAAVELIRNGVVKILVDQTFPMSRAAEAHRYLDQRQHVGKVLLVAG